MEEETTAGSAPASASSSGSNAAGSFECNICFELARDPIVTLCGHLFCWPCLYNWLRLHALSPECPVCKAFVDEDKLIPLYGRGNYASDPRSKSIPNRPAGQRPATAPPPPEPWYMGGGNRLGNFTFSAGIGGIFPFLSFHMHGFPDGFGHAGGFPDGYHGAFHGHGGAAAPPRQQMTQGQQADYILKALLIMGALVFVTLVFF